MSVISEAIHSGVDLLAAIIALFAVKAAARPADSDHAYGHGKYENVSGTIEALLIFLAALWIVWEAAGKLATRQAMAGAGLGAAVMAVSAAMNYAVSALLFRVGRRTDSIALTADAWHLRTDVWTSAGVMAALGVIALGERLFPGTPLWWIDPLAAIAVALLIVRAAWRLTRQSLRDVLDSSLPQEEIEWIREAIGGRPEVKGVHDLRTRKSGAQRFIQFHVIVDPAMSTLDSHRLAEQVCDAIRARFAPASVIAHVEPCDGRCPEKCVSGCLLPEEERRAVRGRGRSPTST
ncbi:MAG: cation transporter [Planctomycetes bacterium]|nr:cation transporter [Planctomycetota bacterium]